MISVSISNQKVCEWLTEVQQQSGKTADDIVSLVLKDYMRKYASAQEVESKLEPSIVDKLISFFADTYLEKFKMPVGETPASSFVSKIFNKMVKAVGNEQTAYELMQKAIVWYIFMHKSENVEGKKFPYQFRILLEQAWLLRQCVESSEPYTIEMIKQAGVMSDPEAAAKLLKRGDLSAGFSTKSVTVEKERVMKLVYRLQKEYGWTDAIRRHPALVGLYSAQMPTIDYIRSAENFLNEQDRETWK